MKASAHPRIAVVGNVNMDIVLKADRFPVPGENVSCHSMQLLPGGKAANQSVAAARLGAQVTLVACISDDVFSKKAFENLEQQGVRLDHLKKIPENNSGIAVVMVDGSGQNRIFSHLGANRELTAEDIFSAREVFRNSDVVLVQLGVQKAAVEAVLKITKELGVPAVLDPTPLAGWLPDNWADAALMIPNETELAVICGYLGLSAETSPREAYCEFRKRGLKELVVKLGAEGCVYFTGDHEVVIPALSGLKVVDTTGAGDAFAGALGTSWVRTGSIEEALRFAVKVGGMTTQHLGAQTAMPTLKEVEGWKS